MRFAGLLVCITLLFSICIMPVSADKADESWENISSYRITARI